MKIVSDKNKTDWMLLLFLIGVTNVKLYIKLALIVIYLMYCLHRNFKFKKPESIHWFYILMPIAGLAGALVHNSFAQDNYALAYGLGTLYWIMAASISYLLYVTVNNTTKEIIHQTIKMFFLANALVSFGELANMMIDSGQLVPYWEWGPDMYYGGATGDHILGITRNISVANAMITAIGTLYFIFTKEMRWVLLSLITSMLCTSNLTLILLLVVVLLIIIFTKEKLIRKYAIYTLIISGCIYPVLSNNVQYIETIYSEDIQYKEYTETELKTIKNITSLEWKDNDEYEITAATFRQKNNDYYKVLVSDSFEFSIKNDLQYTLAYHVLKPNNTTSLYEPADIQTLINKFYDVKQEHMPLSTFHYPIKLYTHMQVLDYLLSDYKNLFGAGTGNFSSKQAIKTTGLDLQGGYPISDIYLNRSFLEYHLYTILYVLSLPPSEHSIINMPNSVYNQVAGEYGIPGILAFIVLYIGYFWKRRKKVGHCAYIIILTLLFLNFEYWFEMMALTVFFELLLFVKIYNVQHEQ